MEAVSGKAIRKVADIGVSTQTTQQRGFGHEPLDREKQRLEQLTAGHGQLRSLRGQECSLEVELIAAEAALKTAVPPGALTVNPENAAKLVTALDHLRRLQEAKQELEGEAGHGNNAGELARLTAGKDALESWLEAPRAGQPPSLSRMAQAVLAAAVLVCLLAAVTVHPLMLLLLFPLLLPLAYFRWARQNTAWLRLGAERRYAATGLKPPVAWQVAAVGRLQSELRRSIELLGKQPGRSAGGAEAEAEQNDAGEVATELLESQALLEALLAESGLTVDDINEETEEKLRLSARVHSTREALNKTKLDYARLRAETEEQREALFRFLSRKGEAPSDGRADLETLDAGLKRLAGDSAEDDAPEAR